MLAATVFWSMLLDEARWGIIGGPLLMWETPDDEGQTLLSFSSARGRSVPGTKGELGADEPKENKETTKAQEEDATNKEKLQSPKPKGKKHLFGNHI